jgi:hypothetical protein
VNGHLEIKTIACCNATTNTMASRRINYPCSAGRI